MEIQIRDICMICMTYDVYQSQNSRKDINDTTFSLVCIISEKLGAEKTCLTPHICNSTTDYFCMLRLRYLV